jgi:hypothetical protein
MPKTLVSGVAKLALGVGPTGPVAYVGADHSVHVIGTDGTKLLDVAASAGADPFGNIALSPDSADVYFYQNADTQDTRGTLMHVAVKSGATPGKVADNVSQKDLQIVDGGIVFLQNVDGMGQFGDAATAKRDGSSLKALGTKVNVGGLQVVNPGPYTWFAMHLTGAMTVMGSTPIDGSAAITGGLAWADYTGAAETALDAAVHAGTFAFSDDGRDAVFVGATSFNATASNFTGKLSFLATRAPKSAIDGKLSGVSEIGPIVARALFVNAPAATMAGVYFVKY